MKTNHATLNIGLNNNPFTAKQIRNHFYDFFSSHIVEMREALGEYEGHDEPTLVVKVSKFSGDDHAWMTIVRTMNVLYGQDCIALRLVEIDTNGFQSVTEGLVYNSDFEGEKYSFDSKYFIEM
jgi:hypothetical protein